MESTELMHYGVKGMKWGVRRATRLRSVYERKAKKQADVNMRIAKTAEEHIRSGRGSDGRRLTDAEINASKKERERHTRAAEQWIAARTDILNMTVSDFTAKDIKQRYKDARSSAGGVYVY